MGCSRSYCCTREDLRLEACFHVSLLPCEGRKGVSGHLNLKNMEGRKREKRRENRGGERQGRRGKRVRGRERRHEKRKKMEAECEGHCWIVLCQLDPSYSYPKGGNLN